MFVNYPIKEQEKYLEHKNAKNLKIYKSINLHVDNFVLG